MKKRLVVALIGLTISFAVPAFAQQKDSVDTQIIEQLAALDQENDEAFSNGDAVAMAATYTEDAVLVNDTGPVYGREAIEKHYDLRLLGGTIIKQSVRRVITVLRAPLCIPPRIRARELVLRGAFASHTVRAEDKFTARFVATWRGVVVSLTSTLALTSSGASSRQTTRPARGTSRTSCRSV